MQTAHFIAILAALSQGAWATVPASGSCKESIRAVHRAVADEEVSSQALQEHPERLFFGEDLGEAQGAASAELATQLEDAAFSTMEKITLGGDQAQVEIRSWFAKIKNRQASGQPISVLEHTTLVVALRSGFLDHDPDPTIKDEIEDALAKSWKHLTGKPPDPSGLLDRLPWSVLKGESHEVQQFHAAAFQNLPPKGASKEVALGKDYVLKFRDFLPAMTALAIGFSRTGSEILAGAVMGYSMASLVEHLIHRFISHAPKRLTDFFKKSGWLAQEFQEAKYSHTTIHHGKTFKAYNRQFESDAAKKSLDEVLAARQDLGKEIRASRYGVSLSAKGVLEGMALSLPLTSALTAVAHLTAAKIGLQPDLAFSLTALSTSLIFIPASKYVHPYLHMSKVEAMQKAGPVMRWFLNTRYVAMMSRLHYGHHEGRGGNFNLVFGADALLGQLRKPTIEQLLEMRKLGLTF